MVDGPPSDDPPESAPLAGLGAANRMLVAGLQRAAWATTETLDVDTILTDRKLENRLRRTPRPVRRDRPRQDRTGGNHGRKRAERR